MSNPVYSTDSSFLQPWSTPVGETGFWIWKKPEYRLVEDYVFEYGRENARKRFWFPKGIEWDKSSTPFWAALLGHTPAGASDAGSLVHDMLCKYRGLLPEGWYQTQMPDGEWVNDPSPWRTGAIHEIYRIMCVLGGMKPSKALVQKTALYFNPKMWTIGA
jgi:hypothetical protein